MLDKDWSAVTIISSLLLTILLLDKLDQGISGISVLYIQGHGISMNKVLRTSETG